MPRNKQPTIYANCRPKCNLIACLLFGDRSRKSQQFRREPLRFSVGCTATLLPNIFPLEADHLQECEMEPRKEQKDKLTRARILFWGNTRGARGLASLQIFR